MMSFFGILHLQEMRPVVIAGYNFLSCSSYSSNADIGMRTRLTDYKRGKGGRSSFSGIVATVFGCSGKFGHYIVNRLGRMGSQVICPYRGDPYYVRDLKLMGDLGQILFVPFHLKDDDSLRRAMQYSNVVLNLTGAIKATSNFSFDAIHVEGAARIARIAREMGVERLIHMSSLNASKEPRQHIISGGSQFLRSKYFGELEVFREFPGATVFRPSDMFGQRDKFLSLYSRRHRRFSAFRNHFIPMWHGGKETVKQPVFIADVAEGVVNAVLNHETAGHVFEAVGPKRYRLDQLLLYLYQILHYDLKRVHFVEFKHFLPYRLKLALLDAMRPTNPIVTMDRMEREFVTDTLTGVPTLEDLGVQLTNLENRIFWEVKDFQQFAYYWSSLGEFPEPDPPPAAAF